MSAQNHESVAEPPENPAVLRLLQPIYDETREEVRSADHKAAILLATIGVGSSLAIEPVVAAVKTAGELGAALLVLALVAGATAIVAAGLTLWPRTLGVNTTGPAMFWGHIAPLNSSQELRDTLTHSRPTEGERLLEQTLWISKIVARKFFWIRVSMVAGAATFVACGTVFALS